MEAVVLIEQIGPLGQPILRQRLAGAGTECRVGRDLGCDIVVDDEHAAPQHALLTLREDGRVSVQDLGTRNGTRIGDEKIPAGTAVIVEQGDVVVGHTRLRIRTRHAPIEPERVFRREFARRHRTLLAGGGVAVCMLYGAFYQWLDAPPSLVRSFATAALVTLGVIALWVGPWLLTTKLNKGSWHVRVHVGIAAIGAAFCAWGHWIAGLVAFAAQWPVLSQLGFAVMGATALAAVYLHLREATHYGRRTSLALASAATLVFGAIAWSITIGGNDGDVNRVALGPDVRLEARRMVPNRDIAEYLAAVDQLKLAAGRERQKSLLDVPLADADD